MGNKWFNFKQFGIRQEYSGMKVGTDSVILGAWVNTQKAAKILDIGTGTGILALMMAQRSIGIIDALEINKEACIEASFNIQSSPWRERIKVIESSFQDFYLKGEFVNSRYDLIISNPPFYSNSIPARTSERTMARHNRSLKISELLEGVMKLLNPGGRLGIILPYKEGREFIGEAKESGLFLKRLLQVRSYDDRPINRLAMEFSQRTGILEEQELIIWNKDQRFSIEYVNLTREFYLNF